MSFPHFYPLVPQSHKQQVLSLYKRALRMLETYYDRREVFRYYAVLLRQRFNVGKQVTDMCEAKYLLRKGEQQFWAKHHPIPKKFPNSPGGCAFEREVIPPDWVLDYWHPLEKAEYPEYFKRREERKQEFFKKWMATNCPEK